LYPEIRTIIEIGGEDSRYISLQYDESLGRTVISDFSMNAICAAGTGSFLDEQSSRLGIRIEDFGKVALESNNAARIAGRCSVFAKTDMIHLQQRAIPICDIVNGLCYALARNFKSTIAKGEKFHKPISFQGGVAANIGVVRAFEDILGLKKGELIIPSNYATLGAIGAALIGMKKGVKEINFRDFVEIEKRLQTKEIKGKSLEPLDSGYQIQESKDASLFSNLTIQDKTDAYLGVDIGSISTNLVILDEKGNLLTKKYLMTSGQPIEAVTRGLKEIGEELGNRVTIKAVCTTGSGRYMIGDIIGADIIKNEITAQARAAVEIDENVDTVFEIGGQDSKYISIRDGVVVDFEMNKVCAAGTGSFLEEQAERLNISIKEEFGQLALSAKNQVLLGERCTVFIGSDIGHYLAHGANRGDIAAGLCYSIVLNYLHRVIQRRKIGNNIFFQGGVAFNHGVCAAFEKVLGKKITVPPNHEVTGAIGCALIARDNTKDKSDFKGFDIAQKKYEVKSYICQGCPNRCEISEVIVGEDKPLFYGSRCGKYDIEKISKKTDIPDLFAEREALLLNEYNESNHNKSSSTITIGIPRSMVAFYEFFPFWKTFFTELGFNVTLSDRTNRKIVQQGLENVTAELCFPIKLLHGHVLNLVEKGVDYIFLPSIIDLESAPHKKTAFNCLYVQSLPYMIKSTFNIQEKGITILDPIIEYQRGEKHLEKVLIKMCRGFNKNKMQVRRAIRKASHSQKRFLKTIKERGEEILNNLKDDQHAIVLIGRLYNTCDETINLSIHKRLKERNIIAIPIDYLSLDKIDISNEWPKIYWEIGHTILKAALFIRNYKNIHPIYLTNFGCNPDSVLLQFFYNAMRGKPYIEIETDEHGADVGVITRIEAFLDSLSTVKDKIDTQQIESSKLSLQQGVDKSIGPSWPRTIYFSRMSDNILATVSALRNIGLKAEILPEPDEANLFWGKNFCSGKECFSCNLMMSDMIKMVKRPDFDPEKSAFCSFGILGPCVASQSSTLGKIILNEASDYDMPVYTYLAGAGLRADMKFPKIEKFELLNAKGVFAIDILIRALHETRPYETNKGETVRVYQECLKRVLETIENDGNLIDVMKEARELFEKIKVDKRKKKSIVAILGDVYVRTNRFTNNDLVTRLENLGVEVWLSPVFEWQFYEIFHMTNMLLSKKQYLRYLGLGIIIKILLINYEKKMLNAFKGYLKNYDELAIENTIKYSEPYVDIRSIKTEVPWDIGKTIEYIKKDVDGIVSPISFTCAAGNMSTTILKRIRDEYDNFPCLVIPYDGLEVTNIQTRLEAFVYQIEEYRKIKSKK
ncbi:MAG: hypothetical protein AMJ42_03940, partial [Deltaproteobacteria bacterium DG_8]